MENEIEQVEFKKTEKGLVTDREPARPPDFKNPEHNACAWIAKRNVDGEPIVLNVKIGEFRFKLNKHFM